ncbi:MAG: hypothetical protein HY023_15725 [Chloroflexi bacterium]|nr:hypothetical protein [Chloroflexota bacterium]
MPFRFDAEDIVRHAGSSVDAVSSGDLRSVTRHAEHVVNLIEGKSGPNYGDLDKNGTVFDPSDGVGMLAYARAIQDQAGAVLAAADATDSMKTHARHTFDSAQNVIDWGTQADELALKLNSAKDLGQARSIAEQLEKLTIQIRDGVDANGNGIVEPVKGEGGMRTAYLHAQYIVAMGVVPVQE